MHLVAILHNIRSVHNVGSIFRTADGAGFTKIYCAGVTPTPLDRFGNVRPDFAKVALGAEKGLPWEKAARISTAIKRLKKEGFKIFAVEQAKNSYPYWKMRERLPAKMAFVMGNEVDGLPPSILALADKVLEIPMHGRKESLNVSVAFGIIAFHFAAAGMAKVQ